MSGSWSRLSQTKDGEEENERKDYNKDYSVNASLFGTGRVKVTAELTNSHEHESDVMAVAWCRSMQFWITATEDSQVLVC